MVSLLLFYQSFEVVPYPHRGYFKKIIPEFDDQSPRVHEVGVHGRRINDIAQVVPEIAKRNKRNDYKNDSRYEPSTLLPHSFLALAVASHGESIAHFRKTQNTVPKNPNKAQRLKPQQT